jgi:hypothetical protein
MKKVGRDVESQHFACLCGEARKIKNLPRRIRQRTWVVERCPSFH